MSYIEKEKLIKADIASIENRVRHAFNQGYDLGFKDGQKRAKPLEQEPFINKPCVSEKVCEHDKNVVLNKIRAEIEPKCDRINSLASVLPYATHREIQELLCEIMDLCKAESEDKE